eukprot:1192535-Prorocentrum_lima.AAC.1
MQDGLCQEVPDTTTDEGGRHNQVTEGNEQNGPGWKLGHRKPNALQFNLDPTCGDRIAEDDAQHHN